jgi:hypothetical protein
MQADVQVAVDGLFSSSLLRSFGIHEEHRNLDLATLTRDGRGAQAIALAQYFEVTSARACR